MYKLNKLGEDHAWGEVIKATRGSVKPKDFIKVDLSNALANVHWGCIHTNPPEYLIGYVSKDDNFERRVIKFSPKHFDRLVHD